MPVAKQASYDPELATQVKIRELLDEDRRGQQRAVLPHQISLHKARVNGRIPVSSMTSSSFESPPIVPRKMHLSLLLVLRKTRRGDSKVPLLPPVAFLLGPTL